MSASVDRVLIALVGASLLHACRAMDATAPTEAGATRYADEPADPLAELAQLEGRMLQLGLTPARSGGGSGVGEAVPGEAGPPEDARVEEQPADQKAGGDGEQEKTENRPDMQQEGTTVTTGTTRPPDPMPAPMAERDHDGVSRCTSVCELSEAICELEVRICTMAKNHGSDPTYVDACERAVDDCEVSGEACDTCVE